MVLHGQTKHVNKVHCSVLRTFSPGTSYVTSTTQHTLRSTTMANLNFKGKRDLGGRHSKVWIICMAASNAFCDKTPMLVSKTTKRRCLKKVPNFPVNIVQ